MVKKVRLAFFDRERSMTMLVNYLCREKQNLIETRVYTEERALTEAVERGGVDVLLATEVEEEFVKTYKERLPQIILLSEGKSVEEQSEFPKVFLYQSASEIVNEILEVLAENDRIIYGADIVLNQTVEMIGGYAPFGGCGVTGFLLEKAECSSADKRSLYISFEEFHGLSYLQKGRKGENLHTGKGMSEVLFYLRQGKGKLSFKLDSIVFSRGNLDYLFAVEDYRDLQDMTQGDARELLRVLPTQKKYECFYFDIGLLSRATLELLESCRVIYMPEAVTQMQLSKKEAFERNMYREGKEQLVRKIQYFQGRRKQ